MSVISGALASRSADNASKANRKSAMETNALNYKMYEQSMGSQYKPSGADMYGYQQRRKDGYTGNFSDYTRENGQVSARAGYDDYLKTRSAQRQQWSENNPPTGPQRYWKGRPYPNQQTPMPKTMPGGGGQMSFDAWQRANPDREDTEQRFIGDQIYGTFMDTDKPLSDFQDSAKQFDGMRESSVATGKGIFNGETEAKAMGNFAPVKAGRIAFRRQSAIDATNKTIADIEATQAARGGRDSSGMRMMRFAGNKAGSDAVASESIKNMEEERALRDYYGIQLPMQSMDLPYQMMQREMSAEQMPQDAYLDLLQKRLQPLTFTRQGNPFQYQRLPDKGIGAFGATMSGIGQLGGSALSAYYKDRSAAQAREHTAALRANQQINSGGGNALGSGWNNSGVTSMDIPAYGGASGNYDIFADTSAVGDMTTWGTGE